MEDMWTIYEMQLGNEQITAVIRYRLGLEAPVLHRQNPFIDAAGATLSTARLVLLCVRRNDDFVPLKSDPEQRDIDP
jgi:hypothetical protein